MLEEILKQVSMLKSNPNSRHPEHLIYEFDDVSIFIRDDFGHVVTIPSVIFQHRLSSIGLFLMRNGIKHLVSSGMCYYFKDEGLTLCYHADDGLSVFDL